MPNAPRSIVVFHMSTLGDLLFSLPALHALRVACAQARITSVIPPAYRELLLQTGLVNDVILRRHQSRSGFVAVIKELKRRAPELAVCFSQSRLSTLHAYLSGAAERAGFAQAAFAKLLTTTTQRNGPPSMRNNLQLVRQMGCRIERDDYLNLVKVDQAHREAAQALLEESGIGTQDYAVIGTGASTRRSVKEWTVEGFAEVIRHLNNTRGLRCLSVGGDVPADLLRITNGCLRDVSGRTSLTTLTALLERASLYVGIDSGVMHLAAAMGRPVVGIFGPTDPEHTGPAGARTCVVRRDLPCSPCMASFCRIQTRECLQNLPASQVIEATIQLGREQC